MPYLFKSCLMKCRVLLWTLLTLIASSRFHSLLRICLKFFRLLLVSWLGQGLLQDKWSGCVCDCLVSIDVDSSLVRDYLMLCGEQVWPWTFIVFGGFKCLLGVEICGWRRGVWIWLWLEASNFWKLFYGSWFYKVMPNILWCGGVGPC